MGHSSRRQKRSVNSLHPAPVVPRRRRFRLRQITYLVIWVVLTLLCLTVVSGRFEIQQHSMEPTFSPGQGIVVSQMDWAVENWLGETAYAAAHNAAQSPLSLRRGQIVVFAETTDHLMIKRVVGLPGEQIRIQDGQVLIDEQPMDEPYLNGMRTDCGSSCGPLTLGPGRSLLPGSFVVYAKIKEHHGESDNHAG